MQWVQRQGRDSNIKIRSRSLQIQSKMRGAEALLSLVLILRQEMSQYRIIQEISVLQLVSDVATTIADGTLCKFVLIMIGWHYSLSLFYFYNIQSKNLIITPLTQTQNYLRRLLPTRSSLKNGNKVFHWHLIFALQSRPHLAH